MKRYIIEMALNYNDEFFDAYGDYIESDTPEQAIEYYRQWLLENGETDIDRYIYTAHEVEEC